LSYWPAENTTAYVRCGWQQQIAVLCGVVGVSVYHAASAEQTLCGGSGGNETKRNETETQGSALSANRQIPAARREICDGC
jgi:hypothetical protein